MKDSDKSKNDQTAKIKAKYSQDTLYDIYMKK